MERKVPVEVLAGKTDITKAGAEPVIAAPIDITSPLKKVVNKENAIQEFLETTSYDKKVDWKALDISEDDG